MHERVERDSLGEIKVPSDKYYGAQTERSKENFSIGGEKMPVEVIHALALIKKAAAIVNCSLELLPKDKRDLIVKAADEVIGGKWDDHFPLVIWQTGSGTQTNMNVNEVISNRAIELAKGVVGSKDPIHPNDHVNMSQSTNDTFPSAMHLAACLLIHKKLLPHLQILYKGLKDKSEEFKEIIKTGRTHLMDAAPLTFGQEFSGYAAQIQYGIKAVERAIEPLSELAIGGTAVGTGLNAHPKYASSMIEEINKLTAFEFSSAPNKFQALSSKDAILEMSGALRLIAADFMKIAADISWSSSGPRCGIAELLLPANEPGSSIMPGKVNPTQCEAMAMVAIQVMGNDCKIGFAGSQGNFQLNVYMPLIIYNLLQSIHLLSDVALSFYKKCLKDIKPNRKRIKENLERSLMLATALNREIGYDEASKIVKKAYEDDLTLKEAALELGHISEKRFDEIVDPKKMIGPH